MGLARQLTRGFGERTQIREIRNSDYPQLGIKESIIPNAVNTTVIGVDVISIRVNSLFEPCLINSFFQAFGSTTNTFRIPFMNLKKGDDGYGLTFANNFLPASSNKGWGVSLKKQALRSYQSSINSFGTVPNINSLNSPSFSNNGVNLILVNPVFINENRRNNGTITQNNFEALKGGVKNVITQKRNGFTFDIVDFKNTKSAFFSTEILFDQYSFATNGFIIHNYRVSGVVPYGTLTYSNTNTNQNNNTAWLLNQRTQYQRKFNPLKNLGT